MAKRYRYAFAKKREAQQGKLSAVLAAVSLVLFVTAVLLAFFLQGQYGYIVGGISLCAMLLSVYGFAMGLKSFSEENRTHRSRYDRLYCKRNHNDRMAGNLSDGNFRLINREV